MSLKFLKQMAEKYNFVYIDSENSIYLKFEAHRNNAPYQVVAWKNDYYKVYPVCEINGNEIVTSNDERTWVEAKSNSMLEKYLIQFKKNYKEAQLKLKIKTIEKDF